MNRTRSSLIAALVVVGVLAACGSDDSDSADEPGAPEVSREALGTPNPATGTPVKIGWVNAEGGANLNYPELRESMEAAVEYANEYLGGLDGHKIEIVRCDDKEDGASATACANQMVDEDVVAVVQGQISNGATYVNSLSPAGIPWTAFTGISAEEFTGDHVYLWNSGVLGQLGGVAQIAKQESWDKVTVLGVNVAGVTAVVDGFATPIFTAAGIELDSALIPPGTPDPTSQVVAALADEPDGVIVYADAGTCRGVIPALAANTTPSGTEPTVFITTTCADKTVLETVPTSDFDGVQIPAYRGPTGDDEETELYLAVMGTYAPDAVSSDAQTSGGYVSMLSLIRAVNSVGIDGEPTAATVDAAIAAATAVPLPLGMGSTFTCDGSAIPTLKAICSSEVISASLEDAVPSGFELIDASEVLLGAFGG